MPTCIYLGERGPDFFFFFKKERGLKSLAVFQNVCQIYIYFLYKFLPCPVCIVVLEFHMVKVSKFIFALFSKITRFQIRYKQPPVL